MPAPQFRETFYQGMGASHVYKTGTAHTTAAEVLAAVTGKQYRLKAFRFIMTDDSSGTPGDVALNNAWLADGTTAFLALGAIGGKDSTFLNNHLVDTGLITLPSNGVTGTAATAVNIDFTAIDADVSYQLDLWYDLI